MQVRVKGVLITLTADQEKQVESELAKRERRNQSFVRVLTSFGFKKVSTKDWLVPDQLCYQQDEYNWFCTIEKYNDFSECWIVGVGFYVCRTAPYSGEIFGDPASLSQRLNDIIDAIHRDKYKY